FGQRNDAGVGSGIRHRIGVAFLAGDRGDVDDTAVARLYHVRRHGTTAEELAGQVYTQHALPFLDRIEHRRHVLAGDAGVVHQHVDLAELLQRTFYGHLHRLGIRDVGLGRAVEIPDLHARAGGAQPLDDRGADALRAAGDHCGPAG